jgi:hypothetical protein
MLVPIRRRGGMLVSLGKWWVLHKKLAAMCCVTRFTKVWALSAVF